jgi:WD40 repeat protein
MAGLSNGTAITVNSSANGQQTIVGSLNTNTTLQILFLESLDSSNIVLVMSDGTFKIFSLTTQAFICTGYYTVSCAGNKPRGFDAWNSTLFAISYCGSYLKLWNSMCQEVASITTNLPRGLKFLSSTILAVGTNSGQILQFNPANNLSQHNITISGHSGNTIGTLAFNGTTLISGGLDRCIYFWTYQTGAQLGKITLGASVINILIFNRNYLAVATGNNIALINLNTSTVMQNLTGHTAQVNYLDYSENQLFSAASDSTVRIWNVPNGSQDGSVNFNTNVNSVLCGGL